MRQVRELLAGNHSKVALEIAKDLHKREPSAESATLLAESYQARIHGLLKLGMVTEAKSLLQLAAIRLPSERHRWEQLAWELQVGGGNFSALVAPLLDPQLAAEQRQKIETAIRQRVDDLSALAHVSSLPATHPLRASAAALNEAFRMVTSGAVSDDVLHLAQVSRRSPLAPWKALIQAIGGFYRGDHDACGRWLKAIAPDSAPARLIDPLRAMLGNPSPGALSPAALNLTRVAGAGEKLVRTATVSLEEAMQGENHDLILARAREAMSRCRQNMPASVDRLRQHILVRCLLLDIDSDLAMAAVGRAKQDAYWSRLLARGFEKVDGHHATAISTVQCWESFREQGVREGWFPPNGLEDSLLWLRMAQVVSRLPADAIESALWNERIDRGRQGGLRLSTLLDAGNCLNGPAGQTPIPRSSKHGCIGPNSSGTTARRTMWRNRGGRRATKT